MTAVFVIYHQSDQLIHHTYYTDEKSNGEDIDDSYINSARVL